MKNKGLIIGAVIVAVVLLCAASCVGSYNSLVSLREDVDAEWANVESQYQRRADLVPNLVATVKGYASHEESVFTEIAESRAKLGGSYTIDSSLTEDEEAFSSYNASQNALSANLGRLLALTEAYPELKANENFLDLQSQLEGTENRIATERNRYNEKARSYNKKRQSFPTVILANMFGFKEKVYFKAEESAHTVPTVSF